MSSQAAANIPDSYGHETKYQRFEILRSQLEYERSSFISHWRELGDYILPRRPRFTVTDTNSGERRTRNIIDSTATMASRTLRSGMMAGITSPARPWFRLSTADSNLNDLWSVKEWLYEVTRRMSAVFIKSNLYNVLPILYGDLGTFGTTAMMVEEDFDGAVIRCYPFPIGSYMIATNDRLKVDVFVRDFQMTVRQLVQKFANRDPKTGEIDWSNFSPQVQNAYRNGQRETWIDVCHVIVPNDDYNPDLIPAKFKRYTSCYYERSFRGSSINNYKPDYVLRESGYDYFPVLAPRWEVTGEDVYGTDCPGMAALGDIKQLQRGEKRSMQAIEKMVNPPMAAPVSLMHKKTSILPGDITFYDKREGGQGFAPVHEVNPRIQELEAKQEQVRLRIRRAFYEDLFLMLANSDRRQITAREIEERHEEKLLALGPVLEQLNQDLLDPLIDITFNIMQSQGLIPKPPEELEGQDLKVEYISIMAQAQKLVGIAGIERFASFVGNVAAATQNPELLDKVNADELIDEYGEAVGISPQIIRSDDEVSGIRASRAEAQRKTQMGQAIKETSESVKNLSQSDTSGDNALTGLIRQAQAGALTPQ
jgi:hypothetical protein